MKTKSEKATEMPSRPKRTSKSYRGSENTTPIYTEDITTLARSIKGVNVVLFFKEMLVATQAVEMLAATRYNLVLTDVNMPRTNGLELLRTGGVRSGLLQLAPAAENR